MIYGNRVQILILPQTLNPLHCREQQGWSGFCFLENCILVSAQVLAVEVRPWLQNCCPGCRIARRCKNCPGRKWHWWSAGLKQWTVFFKLTTYSGLILSKHWPVTKYCRSNSIQDHLTNILQGSLELHCVAERSLFRHDEEAKGQREKVLCDQGFGILQTSEYKLIREEK